MKNFQIKLLIILALALCGLCAFQWYLQNQQHGSIDTLNRLVYQKDADIQYTTNAIATLNQQVEQLDTSLRDTQASAATNAELVVSQAAEIKRLRLLEAGLTNQVTQYQQAVAALEQRLKEACAGIDRQNAAITNLVAQRDEFVARYNDSVKDRNDVVAKYNELAKQVAKMQAGTGNHDNP
jgi:chromosome segregation ATPase